MLFPFFRQDFETMSFKVSLLMIFLAGSFLAVSLLFLWGKFNRFMQELIVRRGNATIIAAKSQIVR